MYFLDLESVSEADLTACGSKVYANDPSTFISMMAWVSADNNDYKIAIRPEYDCILRKEEHKKELEKFLDTKELTLVCFNHTFEKDMLEFCGDAFLKSFGIEKSFKDIKIKYVDTQEMSIGLLGPTKLADAAAYYKVASKDSIGNTLMKATCKMITSTRAKKKTVPGTGLKVFPCTISLDGTEYKYWGSPEAVPLLASYCINDVIVTKQMYYKLCELWKKETPESKAMFRYNLEITRQANNNGIKVDTKRLTAMADLVEEFMFKGDVFAREAFDVDRLTKKAQILANVQKEGYRLSSMRKEQIIDSFLFNEDKPEIVDKLKKYLIFNKSSLHKIKGLQKRVFKGRLYSFLRANGAHTGRWTSLGTNLQNLPRPHSDLKCLKDVDDFLEEMTNNTDLLLEEGNADKLVGCVRTLFIPSDTKKFFIADLSQIEYRVATWHAGDLQKIKKLDEGQDVYKELAAKLFKIPIEKVTPEMRSCGKEGALALQFGVGAKVYRQNCYMKYGVDLTLEEAKEIVKMYKSNNSKIVELHSKKSDEIRFCIQNQKPYLNKTMTNRKTNYGKLFTQITTYALEPEDVLAHKEGKLNPYIQPYTKNGKLVYDRQEVRYNTGLTKINTIHGPKSFQNQIQAEARDILLLKMIAMHKKGYKLALTVHDEVIYEIPHWGGDIQKEWENAGKLAIETYFPGISVASDSGFLERYYKI